MILSSPTKNILTRIYAKTWLKPNMKKERKILNEDRCLIKRSPEMIQLLHSPIVLVGERKAADALLASAFVVESFLNKIWLNQRRKIYEYNKGNTSGKWILAFTNAFQSSFSLLLQPKTEEEQGEGAQSVSGTRRSNSLNLIHRISLFGFIEPLFQKCDTIDGARDCRAIRSLY